MALGWVYEAPPSNQLGGEMTHVPTVGFYTPVILQISWDALKKGINKMNKDEQK